mgnify:CR=1 FL=1|tara:strand:+ start:212 stop:1234 length:1023 start_codon:yes stop_codon:yes gene_type:complete
MIQIKTVISLLPTFIKRLIAGKEIIIDNQKLNLNSQLLLKNFYKIINNKICNLTPDGAREMIDRFVKISHNPKVLNTMCDIKNDFIDCNKTSLPIRIYRPKGNNENISTLIYYHGGGFVIGTLEMYDYLCASYSVNCNIQVISIDYRLAPENKFPIPVLDCIAAYNQLFDNASNYNINTNYLAVAGDSAGGNLATVVTSEAIKNNKTPKFQVLIYPVVKNEVTKSVDLFKEGFLLETDDMYWFADHYVGKDIDDTDPKISPIYSDNLDQMPDTLIVIAGFDPLRDGAFEYAKKLKDNNINVITQIHSDQFHGFYHMNDVLPEADIAVKQTCNTINMFFKN